jgi:hypothetical protein
MKKSVNTKTNISNLVKTRLPKLHEQLIKKFKGKHNLINNFIYVPDIINGDDTDGEKNIIRNAWELSEFLSVDGVSYTLFDISLDKSLNLKFHYLFQDDESGLCSAAHVIETSEGWKVKKIESYT